MKPAKLHCPVHLNRSFPIGLVFQVDVELVELRPVCILQPWKLQRPPPTASKKIQNDPKKNVQ
jgi:hypothetical protein